jgi:hypothetical protein
MMRPGAGDFTHRALVIRLRTPQSFRENSRQFTGRFEDNKALSREAFESDLRGIYGCFDDLWRSGARRGVAPGQ